MNADADLMFSRKNIPASINRAAQNLKTTIYESSAKINFYITIVIYILIILPVVIYWMGVTTTWWKLDLRKLGIIVTVTSIGAVFALAGKLYYDRRNCQVVYEKMR